MSSFAQPVPALVAPYLSNLSENSLLLITYVLGASANWLLLRLLHATLKPKDADRASDTPGVILISFLRDHAFWRDSARKTGLDITTLASRNRFLFIDGLSELFSSDPIKPGKQPAVSGDHVVLKDASLDAVEAAVLELIKRMNGATTKTVLLVDGLDFLMAAKGVGAREVGEMVREWREHVHSMAITASADSPLIHDSKTPLETEHLAHVVGLGHQANLVMGLRGLETGTAKDVSGVLRVSRGAMAEDGVREGEFLYFVGGDGGVKVFERGA